MKLKLIFVCLAVASVQIAPLNAQLSRLRVATLGKLRRTRVWRDEDTATRVRHFSAPDLRN